MEICPTCLRKPFDRMSSIAPPCRLRWTIIFLIFSTLWMIPLIGAFVFAIGMLNSPLWLVVQELIFLLCVYSYLRGDVGELFQSKPTRIERQFTNVMRVVGLSMPPEEADEMREAQYEFEKAMANLQKITLGVRRDLPVELDPQIVSKAKAAWDDGRVGLNKL